MSSENAPGGGADQVPPKSGGTGQRPEEQEPTERLVVRDKRRIDPTGTRPRPAPGPATTGSGPTAAKETAGTDVKSKDSETGGTEAGAEAKAEETPAPGADEVAKLQAELDERTRDLKRVVAEYANYRRRVDRDRSVAAEQATGLLLQSVLPVLDDLDRAREHGDLVGPFAAVADQLLAVLTKAGLTAYGEPGDPFDPMQHEAVAHSLSPDVTEPTCVMVMRRGYRHGERMLRPAMVAVAEPDPDAPAPVEPAELIESDPAGPAQAAADGEPEVKLVEPEPAGAVAPTDTAEASAGSGQAEPAAEPEKPTAGSEDKSEDQDEQG